MICPCCNKGTIKKHNNDDGTSTYRCPICQYETNPLKIRNKYLKRLFRKYF